MKNDKPFNKPKRSHLNRLRIPRRKDDISWLLPRSLNKRRTAKTGIQTFYEFETDDEIRSIDTIRDRKLDEAISRGYSLTQRRLMKKYKKALDFLPDGEPPESRAIASFMRPIRRNLSGEILRLRRCCYPDMMGMHIISPKWEIDPEDLTPKRIRAILKEMRNYLDRLPLKGVRGILIANLDGEYNELKRKYLLHFHCVIAGDFIELVKGSLREKEAFRPFGQGHNPIQFNTIKDAAPAVSYTIKHSWTYRAIGRDSSGKYRFEVKTFDMPEPYSSIYLATLNALKIGETFIFKGVYISKGRMILRHRPLGQ